MQSLRAEGSLVMTSSSIQPPMRRGGQPTPQRSADASPEPKLHPSRGKGASLGTAVCRGVALVAVAVACVVVVNTALAGEFVVAAFAARTPAAKPPESRPPQPRAGLPYGLRLT
jgi:hypothetical protein